MKTLSVHSRVPAYDVHVLIKMYDEVPAILYYCSMDAPASCKLSLKYGLHKHGHLWLSARWRPLTIRFHLFRSCEQ